MAALPEVLARSLRYRSLLRRPAVIRELTQIAEDEPTYGNVSAVCHSGDVLYAQMIEDISQAQKRVLCEFYMFLSDETAWGFARALAEKAAEGWRSWSIGRLLLGRTALVCLAGIIARFS